MRFFDAQKWTPLPYFADAEAKPEMINYLTGDLTHGWDIRVGPSPESLQVPIFLAQGRYDYVVPYTLWDGIVEEIPGATLEISAGAGTSHFLRSRAFR